MKNSSLFTPLSLKGHSMKNRLILPPMVKYSRKNSNGFVEEEDLLHYEAPARSGMGAVIVEAACVDPEGRLHPHQLGIWDDAFLPGLARLSTAIHKHGALALIQIHHAGLLSHTAQPLSSSPCSRDHRGKHFIAREMTQSEISATIQNFSQAARRAEAAGFDGVEIHGCHHYLISQFLSSRVNHRNDIYGQKREQLALEILTAVKNAVTENFIVGVRLGAFEPTLEDGLYYAKTLETAGADYLNISYGAFFDHSPEKPAGYPYVEAIYGAQEIKRCVDVPVFAVNSITSAQMAEDVLRTTGVDGVCIGRGVLVNPDWAADAMAGRDTGRCFHCSLCHWRGDLPFCPGRVELEHRGSK
ncbi:MAG: NADH:flavin oxidoreductase [Oscillospiraceae bacterium]|nr:NADH:flavin oxidoreductase [Oscillospiraceae bacterium]